MRLTPATKNDNLLKNKDFLKIGTVLALIYVQQDDTNKNNKVGLPGLPLKRKQ